MAARKVGDPGPGLFDDDPAFFELTPPEPAPELLPKSHGSPVYTASFLRRAEDLFARGASYKTVANSLSIPVYTAREWQHRYRAGTLERLCKGDAPSSGHDPELKKEVLRMRFKECLSYNEIVRRTGLSRSTVRTWTQGMSLPEAARKKAADEGNGELF